jgi:hypothetical protein
MKAHTTSCDPANEYTVGSVRVEERAILHVARTALSISSIRGQRVDEGECHMGLCDSAPGTDDYPAKALNAVFGYGAVVAAPCADS